MRVKTASVRVAVATLLALLVAPACGRGTTGASDAAADADIDAPTDATEAGDLGTDLGDGLDADAPRIEHNGVAVQEQDGDLTLTGDLLVVRYHLAEGRLDILGTEGRVVVQGAFARAVLAGPGAATATFDTTSQDLVSWQAEPCSEPLGEGVAVTLVRQSKAAGNPGLVVRLWVLHRAAYLLADLSVDLPDGDPRRVQSLSPMVVEGSRAGGLFIGHDPLQHFVVDNGTDKYFDFTARVFAVGNGDSLLFGPGSASNWNAAIHDPESGRAVVAGFLTFNKGLGLVLLDFSAKDALVDDGRQGFTRFEGRIGYDPPRPPDPGGDGTSHLASERFYLDVNPQTAQEGLEQYAARVAANAGKKLWTDVPSGWNSWGGGSGSHGLGQDIDEPTILANLEAMAQDFPHY